MMATEIYMKQYVHAWDIYDTLILIYATEAIGLNEIRQKTLHTP